MGARQRICRLTDAGRRAWAGNPGLRPQYRRILELIEGDTHSDLFGRVLASCSEQQILDWLDELQTLGFIESDSACPEHDLDFTGSFQIAEFLARPQAA